MLTFAVFDKSGPAIAFPLRHAHCLINDGVTVSADIELERGSICVEKSVDGSAGLGLNFPTESVEVSLGGTTSVRLGGGNITLHTCMLPERERPYLLSLELARHQIMLLLNKLEEWSLFEHAADDPVLRLVEKAREAFTEALLATRYDPTITNGYTNAAERAARRALDLGVAAGEAMAILQARLQHTRRVTGELARIAAHPPPANALTDSEARQSKSMLAGSPGVILTDFPKVGCRVNPAFFAPELANSIAGACDFVCLPMRWVEMEPTEGKYSFTRTDRWIEWAIMKAKLPVHAGPVLDLHPSCVPDWLYIWEHDYETFRDVVCDYVKNLVTRYRKTVHTWCVASGLNVGGSFRLTYEQCMELTKLCCALVKKLQPQARVSVELAMPFGEYTGMARGAKAIAPGLYAELINQVQVECDILGVRLQAGHADPGRSARDLLTISSLLDDLASYDKPISISVMGCPSRAAQPNETPADAALEPGHWRAPWSEQTQSAWLASVAAMVAAKPYVTSICWQELLDAPATNGGEMPGGGLMATMAQPKPALRALSDLRAALREKKPALPGLA
jgi:hypothetical protein